MPVSPHNDPMSHQRPQIISALARSIAQLGQLQPIVVDANQQIIDGHLRTAACRQAGVEPWIVVQETLPSIAQHHSLIRRSPSPQDLADIIRQVRMEEAGEGARRAPGTGKLKDIVSKRLAEEFAITASPRLIAYANGLAQASPEERAALDAAAPSSMRAAHQLLGEHRLGGGQPTEEPAADRTLLLKRAHEFKAAVQRSNGPITQADRDLLLDLRAAIDGLLARGSHHAVA